MSSPPLPASAVPRIGVAVFVLHPVPSSPSPSSTRQSSKPQQYKFILGRRLGSHGSNTWALPGGHLEFGETFEDCAVRETREETDLEIEDVRFLTVTNDVMPFGGGGGGGRDQGKDGRRVLHYATIFMVARVKAGSGIKATDGDVEEEGTMPEAKVMEPHKCAGWEWVNWEDLERWGEAQVQREQSGSSNGENGARTASGIENGITAGDFHAHGKQQARQLFTPMVNLLLQRPGIAPRL